MILDKIKVRIHIILFQQCIKLKKAKRDLVVISKKPKIDDDVIDSCIKTISNIVEEYQYTERDVFEIMDGA